MEEGMIQLCLEYKLDGTNSRSCVEVGYLRTEGIVYEICVGSALCYGAESPGYQQVGTIECECFE